MVSGHMYVDRKAMTLVGMVEQELRLRLRRNFELPAAYLEGLPGL